MKKLFVNCGLKLLNRKLHTSNLPLLSLFRLSLLLGLEPNFFTGDTTTHILTTSVFLFFYHQQAMFEALYKYVQLELYGDDAPRFLEDILLLASNYKRFAVNQLYSKFDFFESVIILTKTFHHKQTKAVFSVLEVIFEKSTKLTMICRKSYISKLLDLLTSNLNISIVRSILYMLDCDVAQQNEVVSEYWTTNFTNHWMQNAILVVEKIKDERFKSLIYFGIAAMYCFVNPMSSSNAALLYSAAFKYKLLMSLQTFAYLIEHVPVLQMYHNFIGRYMSYYLENRSSLLECSSIIPDVSQDSDCVYDLFCVICLLVKKVPKLTLLYMEQHNRGINSVYKEFLESVMSQCLPTNEERSVYTGILMLLGHFSTVEVSNTRGKVFSFFFDQNNMSSFSWSFFMNIVLHHSKKMKSIAGHQSQYNTISYNDQNILCYYFRIQSNFCYSLLNTQSIMERRIENKPFREYILLFLENQLIGVELDSNFNGELFRCVYDFVKYITGKNANKIVFEFANVLYAVFIKLFNSHTTTDYICSNFFLVLLYLAMKRSSLSILDNGKLQVIFSTVLPSLLTQELCSSTIPATDFVREFFKEYLASLSFKQDVLYARAMDAVPSENLSFYFMTYRDILLTKFIQLLLESLISKTSSKESKLLTEHSSLIMSKAIDVKNVEGYGYIKSNSEYAKLQNNAKVHSSLRTSRNNASIEVQQVLSAMRLINVLVEVGVPFRELNFDRLKMPSPLRLLSEYTFEASADFGSISFASYCFSLLQHKESSIVAEILTTFTFFSNSIYGGLFFSSILANNSVYLFNHGSKTCKNSEVFLRYLSSNPSKQFEDVKQFLIFLCQTKTFNAKLLKFLLDCRKAIDILKSITDTFDGISDVPESTKLDWRAVVLRTLAKLDNITEAEINFLTIQYHTALHGINKHTSLSLDMVCSVLSCFTKMLRKAKTFDSWNTLTGAVVDKKILLIIVKETKNSILSNNAQSDLLFELYEYFKLTSRKEFYFDDISFDLVKILLEIVSAPDTPLDINVLKSIFLLLHVVSRKCRLNNFILDQEELKICQEITDIVLASLKPIGVPEKLIEMVKILNITDTILRLHAELLLPEKMPHNKLSNVVDCLLTSGNLSVKTLCVYYLNGKLNYTVFRNIANLERISSDKLTDLITFIVNGVFSQNYFSSSVLKCGLNLLNNLLKIDYRVIIFIKKQKLSYICSVLNNFNLNSFEESSISALSQLLTTLLDLLGTNTRYLFKFENENNSMLISAFVDGSIKFAVSHFNDVFSRMKFNGCIQYKTLNCLLELLCKCKRARPSQSLLNFMSKSKLVDVEVMLSDALVSQIELCLAKKNMACVALKIFCSYFLRYDTEALLSVKCLLRLSNALDVILECVQVDEVTKGIACVFLKLLLRYVKAGKIDEVPRECLDTTRSLADSEVWIKIFPIIAKVTKDIIG